MGKHDPRSLLSGITSFALLPLTGLALVALPALDAHTRLLFGRSLAYQVTEKVAQPRPLRRRAVDSPTSSVAQPQPAKV